MENVKFGSEQQKKMKGISKALYIISKISNIACRIGLAVVLFTMVVLPFIASRLKITDLEIKYDNYVVGSVSDIEIIPIKDFINNHSINEMVIYSEIVFLCLIIGLIIAERLFKNMEKLFKNINSEDTPFKEENIKYIRKIAMLSIAALVVPTLTGTIMECILRIDLKIEFSIMNIISILVIFGIAYIFEYGYALQLEANRKVKGDKNE